MSRYLLLAGGALAIVATLVMGRAEAGTASASGAAYYVVKADSSKSCVVTKAKPDGKKAVQVGDVHDTMAGAEAAMRAATECRP